MISIQNALEIILEETKLQPTQEVGILEASGYILAQDIFSKDTLPPFNKSAMDGYAYNMDKASDAKTLKVVALVKAGDYYEKELNPGEAVKIMTGAPVPASADTVIEIEKVKAEKDTIIIESPVKKGSNIIFKGEELVSGDLVLEKGKQITPADIGLLASLGYPKVSIYKPPTVACLVTGDELVDIDQEISKGKIRNCNTYTLEAMINQIKAVPVAFDIIPDDKEVLKATVLKAFDTCDFVVSTGGASVGDFDFVLEVLEEIGAEIKFTKVAIKPGKPITFAKYKNKLFFSLPGNPMSVITAFEQFVKPSLRQSMGNMTMEHVETIPMKIGDGFKLRKGRTKYIFVDVEKVGDEYIAYNTSSQCSNHLMTVSKSDAVLIIPENIEDVNKGDIHNGRFIFK